MARPAQPLDPAREEELLLTAARHFASAGYAGTSLNTVIAEANWGKSSFYHYFTNKRQLHDHVVRTLAGRLIGNARLPDLDALTAADFWPAMTELLEVFTRAAARHPETAYLGEMFHAPTSKDDGSLQRLRQQVDGWFRDAVVNGRAIGVVRTDLPEQLLVELTVAVLQTLDRWAVRHKAATTGGPPPDQLLQLVRDLIEQR